MSDNGLELGPGEKISIIGGTSPVEYPHEQLVVLGILGILVVCAFLVGCWLGGKLRNFWRHGDRHG